MNKTVKIILKVLALAILIVAATYTIKAYNAHKAPSEPIVINTTELCKDVIGHHATTPVEITIVDGKIQSVKALPSDETPSYYQYAVEVLKAFEGLTVKKALEADVDAVSGATMSSVALIKNVKAALQTLE